MGNIRVRLHDTIRHGNDTGAVSQWVSNPLTNSAVDDAVHM